MSTLRILLFVVFALAIYGLYSTYVNITSRRIVSCEMVGRSECSKYPVLDRNHDGICCAT